MNSGDRIEPYLHAGPDPAPGPALRRHRPEFTGETMEYFGIWIVNLVLSVLTLGIYSAWAKVRSHRYLYANTRMDGAPFEYLADPITILKGRLIAYALLIVLGVSVKLQMLWVFIPLYLLLFATFPWLIQLGLRFRARYSAWRGLRFRFEGSVGDAYINFMLLPIASLFTLHLLLPYVVMQQQKYAMGWHSYGGRKFSFNGDVGKYYAAFIIAIGLGLTMMVIMVTAIAAGAAGLKAAIGETVPGTGMSITLMVLLAVMYLAFLTVPIYLRTKWCNLMWGNTALGAHRFASTLQVRTMIWLYLSNGLAILLSLGLAVPWATIRMLRYRLSCTELLAHGSLDDFVAQASASQSAAGAELVDALDLGMDIAL